ncbi:MAG: hypothetical protein ACNA7W_05535 [Pseudomonadales bacterium]
MTALLQATRRELGLASDLLAGIDDETFTRPCLLVFDGSVGKHVRHNLDHYHSFLAGLSSGVVDYDQRARSQRVERSREMALAALETVTAHVSELTHHDRKLRIRLHSPRPGGGECCEPSPAWAESTVQRELAFLLSHTVHHHAIIAIIARYLGADIDPQFGVARATLVHAMRANGQALGD